MMITRFLFLVAALVVALSTAQGACSETRQTAPMLVSVSASNGDTAFKGDDRVLTTISPNGDGFRDRAAIHFTLARAATVRFEIVRSKPAPKTVFSETVRLPRGPNTLHWAPPASIAPRTYIVHLTLSDSAGNRRAYGAYRPRQAARRETPVVRVQGIDAGFTRESYAPGGTGYLALATDASELSLQILRSGPERVATRANDVMNGVPVTKPRTIPWGRGAGPRRIRVAIGDWRTGLYFARLTSPDGRVGYAPFVVRPRRLGESRIAVVLPTQTWQAYNFRDDDGDGFGDTWYAGWFLETAGLGRPYLNRGVPEYFRRYDLPFLHWLSWSARRVDYLSDGDLDRVRSGEALARAYDLVVFPGHHEYVTGREYDVVERYRNLGGNLMFLSADNFFWGITRHGRVMRRTAEWRRVGRPEAALVGVQYRGNDRGEHRGPYIVRDTAATPWLFAGTGLSRGSRLAEFGIEIDGTAPSSPRGTRVLAEIPNLYGPGYTAQMTYYETRRGAKVFAAGAFTLAGLAMERPVSVLLANLWTRLARP